MTSRPLPALAAASLLSFGVLLAQTAPTPPSITLASFTEESIITQEQLTSPNAPTLPDDLVMAIQSSQLELHQLLSYDATKSTLMVSLLALTPGSPIPSTSSVSGNLVYSYTVNVKSIAATEAAIAVSGVITSGQGMGGSMSGGLLSVTAGFTLQGPNSTGAVSVLFTTVNVSVAGIGSLGAKTGAGLLKLGGGAAKLPVAVAGPKGQQVFTPSFTLSATGSTDPNGGKLTYQWAFIPGAGQSVNFQSATSATPLVTIADDGTGAAFGLYTFQLTVANASGLGSIDTVTIDYEGGQ
jgi:hypothetical protein